MALLRCCLPLTLITIQPHFLWLTSNQNFQSLPLKSLCTYTPLRRTQGTLGFTTTTNGILAMSKLFGTVRAIWASRNVDGFICSVRLTRNLGLQVAYNFTFLILHFVFFKSNVFIFYSQLIGRTQFLTSNNFRDSKHSTNSLIVGATSSSFKLIKISSTVRSSLWDSNSGNLREKKGRSHPTKKKKKKQVHYSSPNHSHLFFFLMVSLNFMF